MLNITDIIIASFLLKLKKRAPVIEAPDLLVPGKTAKDCHMPIITTSLAEISKNCRLLGFLSDVNSKRANIKLVKAIISNCLDISRRRAYSKNKAIKIRGIVAKSRKKIEFVIPIFFKTLLVLSFKGLTTNKMTARRLPICIAMSKLRLLLIPITNLL